MEATYADVVNLTAETIDYEMAHKAAMRFAWNYGWRPSFFLATDFRNRDEIASAHLVIEQGLENTAVITFLRGKRYDSLTRDQVIGLLKISYNYLIDWHIVVDDSKVTFLNNRTKKNKIDSIKFDQTNLDALRYQRFLKISNDFYDFEIEKLDEKLLSVIAQRRRMLYSILKERASVEALSNFFNGIIFCRALEDQKIAEGAGGDLNLVDFWFDFSSRGGLFKDFFFEFSNQVFGHILPEYILQKNELNVFDDLEPSTIASILKDFYGNSIYNYDFSLMNKHALGKIYEKYVTQLSIPYESQPNLFEMSMPADEKGGHLTGTVYTPQYIASFFTKYAIQELGHENLLNTKHIDPACGSGIFLRNLAEKVMSSLGHSPSAEEAGRLFTNLYALDINKNATYSSILSLSLLYLSVTGSFPSHLNIEHTDSLAFLNNSDNEKDFYTVFSNPPYINSDNLLGSQKSNAQKAIGIHQKGKFDIYLAFLIASINALAEGGIGFFVIPHTFLTNPSASLVRKYISDTCWVKGVVDLSDVKVFSDVWTYVILLIVQKKNPLLPTPRAKIAKVYTNPGVALEDYLENDSLSNEYVEIYTAPQSSIAGSEWSLLSSEEQVVLAKFNALPKLDGIFDVMQGLATGDDSVFIVDQPIQGEEDIYKPFLPDKSIRRFQIPRETNKYVIYPYNGKKLIIAEDFAKLYPKTWKYLSKFKKTLSIRARKTEANWWSLSTPRNSSVFEQPKIVTPNLVLDTKFAVDSGAGYYLTRTTFIYLKDFILDELSITKGSEEHVQILRFYASIMNSPAYLWSVSHKARKYAQSYIKIEVNLIKESRIPDFRQIGRRDFLLLSKYAEKMEGNERLTPEEETRSGMVITRMYGLTQSELGKITNA